MPLNPEDVFRLMDLTGVFMTAVLGGMIARREGLDPIGLLTLAVISCLGGGMIRDMLLRQATVSALSDAAYLMTALAGAGPSYLGGIYGPLWRRLWPVMDAVALGTWAAAGTQKSLSFGLDWVPAIMLGVVTAVGGGVIRDVLLRRVPAVLGGNTLYATCAVVAGAIMAYFSIVLRLPSIGQFVAAGAGGVLTLLASWRGWVLPSVDEWSPAVVVEKAGRAVQEGLGYRPPRRTGATSAGRRMQRGRGGAVRWRPPGRRR